MHRTVKYELLSLEAWLATGKRPNRALSGKIKAEAIRIREALLTDALSLTDESHVQRYVRTHHFGVIQLLDKLWSKSDLQAEVNTALVELLIDIERNFPHHLDPEAELCLLHRQQLAQQCKEMVRVFTETFAKSTIAEKLQAAIVNIFQELISARTISYRQRKFVSACISELNNLLANTPEQTHEEALSKFLVGMDCNTEAAFDFWRTWIRKQVNATELKVEKCDQLTSFQREIQFILVKPTASYCTHSVPLRDQLLTFIAEELSYLERSFGQKDKITTHTMPDNFRVRTELSVSQLACFVKTLVDTRIIVNPNVSELLRFFAQTIESKRAETISFDSLRAKYYNIESGTKEALRQTLQSLVKNLS